MLDSCYRWYSFCLHVKGEWRPQELTPDQEVKLHFAVGCCGKRTYVGIVISRNQEDLETGNRFLQTDAFTIFSQQQLVDDVAKVLHFRAGRNGKRNIVHNVPTTMGGKHKGWFNPCYSHLHHVQVYILAWKDKTPAHKQIRGQFRYDIMSFLSLRRLP